MTEYMQYYTIRGLHVASMSDQCISSFPALKRPRSGSSIASGSRSPSPDRKSPVPSKPDDDSQEVNVDEPGREIASHVPKQHDIDPKVDRPDSPRSDHEDRPKSAPRSRSPSPGPSSPTISLTNSDLGSRNVTPLDMPAMPLPPHGDVKLPPFGPLNFAGHSKKSALEMLGRLFPHMKRAALQQVVHDCNNDPVIAIEQILAKQKSAHAPSAPGAGGRLAITHKPYATTAADTCTTTGVKSAFSPINSAALNSFQSLQYAYASNSRGLAFMPYPTGFLPSLPLGPAGYNYGAFAAAASAGNCSNVKQTTSMYGINPYMYHHIHNSEKQNSY